MKERTVCEGCEHLEVVDTDFACFIRCNLADPPLYMLGEFDPSKQIRPDCPLNDGLS